MFAAEREEILEKLADSDEKLMVSQSENSALRSENEKMTAETLSLKSELENALKNFQNEMAQKSVGEADSNAEIDNLRQKLTQNDSEISDLTQKLRQSESEISDLSQKISQLDAVKEHNRALNGETEVLKGRVRFLILSFFHQIFEIEIISALGLNTSLAFFRIEFSKIFDGLFTMT